MSEGYVLTIPSDKYYFKGRREGKIEGIDETRRNNALSMLADGKLSIDEISRYSGLSKEEVENLKY